MVAAKPCPVAVIAFVQSLEVVPIPSAVRADAVDRNQFPVHFVPCVTL
jgi:hypothetical protein